MSLSRAVKQIVPEEREFLVPEKMVILMKWGEFSETSVWPRS